MELLSPEEQKALLDLGRQHSYQPGEHLVQEGQRSTGVYILESGCAKVTGNTIDGKLVTIDIRVAGDLVGEFATLDGGPRSNTVTAATRLNSRFVSQPDFHTFLDAHSSAARATSRSITAKLRFSSGQRLDMRVSSPEVRLARVLGHLCGRPRREEDGGGVLIAVQLSQHEIADLIGSSQPNVQRAFAYLRRRKVVDTEYRRQVILNPELLESIANLRDTDIQDITTARP
jgi:CRP-like cAMP-binding protein